MAKEKHRLEIGQHVRISERKAHRYDDIGTMTMDDGDDLFMLPYTVVFDDGDSGQYDHRDLTKVTMPTTPSFRDHSELQAAPPEDIEQVFFIVVDIESPFSQDEGGGAHWTNTRYPTLHEAEAAAIRRTVLTGDKLFVMKSVSFSESKARITAMSRQTE